MPWHWKLQLGVVLGDPEGDVQSPSRFVEQARRVRGVTDAYRVTGRFDAVVLIDGGEDDATKRALLQVQGMKGVARTEVWLEAPDHP